MLCPSIGINGIIMIISSSITSPSFTGWGGEEAGGGRGGEGDRGAGLITAHPQALRPQDLITTTTTLLTR
jgi:hypothetical protein